MTTGIIFAGRHALPDPQVLIIPPAGGTIELNSVADRLSTPGDALKRRVVYVTEDRRLEGFVKDFDNGQNMTLAALPAMSPLGVVRVAAERRRADELIKEFQVKGGRTTLTATLSGGNQQKVVVSKWLETKPEFIVLDEPTKGIDVGARANIYEIIHDVAAQGCAVLVVSSEADELLSLCHRILVMRNGEVVDEFDPIEADTDDLIRTALVGRRSDAHDAQPGIVPDDAAAENSLTKDAQ